MNFSKLEYSIPRVLKPSPSELEAKRKAILAEELRIKQEQEEAERKRLAELAAIALAERQQREREEKLAKDREDRAAK
jgi:hypothetical protein